MSSKENAKKKLLEILNQSISREIAVSIQYMWNHVMAIGTNAEDIGGVFEDFAKVEMKHAEKFAERIWYRVESQQQSLPK
ncbi:MAG TPA: ferritin-like domain-containing protein [Candidatus Bathyarchaeia archaeon]|nr:ferritin-like domain-containing protein [Candidatus Bathyarchaeia archaeon]